ncbi:hypothetical protein C8Q75DRAFT_788476 [Abortiporus biennis]|nr:hypothetical protein C8Q75DRAFT_788476 [Abortiporus biennis]
MTIIFLCVSSLLFCAVVVVCLSLKLSEVSNLSLVFPESFCSSASTVLLLIFSAHRYYCAIMLLTHLFSFLFLFLI